jgi:hypothetical protein
MMQHHKIENKNINIIVALSLSLFLTAINLAQALTLRMCK